MVMEENVAKVVFATSSEWLSSLQHNVDYYFVLLFGRCRSTDVNGVETG